MSLYLDEKYHECCKLLRSLKIPYGNIVSVKSSRQLRKPWGRCKRSGDKYTILINSILTDGNHDAGLINTLIHEMLHTCPDCMEHNKKWHHYVDIVYRKTGIQIKELNNCNEKGVTLEDKIKNAKYVLMCTHCDGVILKYRECMMTDYPELFRCSICGSKIKRIR